jgi:hypothetical protein
MIERIKAIHSLRPGAEWVMRDETIEWLDKTQTQPTEAEIQVEIIRLEADYAAKEYQRQRAAEYPSFAEQFDLLYHGGMDAWKAAIQSIKDKYPKS